MNLRRIHYVSGIVLCAFIGMHLFNHFYGILGADAHISMMAFLRMLYRNFVAETILLAACGAQIVTGLALVRRRDRADKGKFYRLQIWSGLYLSLFLMIHLGAVLAGRWVLHLDTNFYFAAAGLNTFPFLLLFIPYYGLAILAITAHLAAIHSRKMQRNLLGLTPDHQALVMIAVGLLATILILYGMTGHFQGIEIPAAYSVLVGR